MVRKFKISTKKKYLDRLFSQLIHFRDGVCQWCNKGTGKLDAAHILAKSDYPGLRYNEENAILLCFCCHRRWHNNPIETAEWYHNKYGYANYKRLVEKNKEPYVFDLTKFTQEKQRLQKVIDVYMHQLTNKNTTQYLSV